MNRLIPPAIRVAVLVALLANAADASSTRNYLTVEGEVFDHLATPLPGTWIFCTGSRRASAIADSSGAFRLEIPGATLEELQRTPLKIRIAARRKGWRFALADGSPELGLELKVTKDDRLSHLRVRSNDSSAVIAVANSVVLDANPRALLSATFVGSQGAQYDTPPVPLELSDVITLAGDTPIPELPGNDAPPATALAPMQADPTPARVQPRPASPARSSARPATPSGDTASSAPPAASRGGTADPSPIESRRSRPPISAPVTTPMLPPVSVPVADAAPSAPAVSAPPTSARSSNAADGKKRGHKRKWNAANPEEGREPPAGTRSPAGPNASRLVAPGDTPSGIPAVTAGDTTQHPEATQPGRRGKPGEPLSMGATEGSGDTGASEGSRSQPPDPSLKPVLRRDTPVSGVGTAPPPPTLRVPVAPGAPRPKSPGNVAPRPGMCDCELRGTVEVQSEKPLSGRTDVVISVEDAPGVNTSAELFMGSPRAFEIHGAPCGAHRLLLWTRSRQRFVLVSSEPRVVCTPGGVQQLRLVLEPVARWGTNR